MRVTRIKMSTDIVFINPNLTLAERYASPLNKVGSSLPPMGITLLAAIVTKKGYQTKIIDSVTQGYSTEAIVQAVIQENPHYIGITAVTAAIPKAMNLARALKKKMPEPPILLGGPHVTTVPSETMKLCNEFDIGCLGECEETLPELLEALDNKKDLYQVRGIIFRKNGELIKTELRPQLEELDELPFPAWKLLPNLARYYRPAANCFYRLPSGSLVTSRGCPYRCTFCDRTMSGSRLRAFSVRYTLEMIKQLYRDYGIRDIFFYDDNFTVFKDRLFEFCNYLINDKSRISWACLGRVDMVEPKILKLMKRAGCWQIGYGIESGSQRILDFLQKGITLDQIREAVHWTKKAGIQVRGTFMLGVPTETKESIGLTKNFILELPLDDFHLFTFMPLPGLPILQDIEKYGTFDRDISKQTGWWFNFIPRGLHREELRNYHKLIFRKFYLRPRIILKYIKRGIFNPKKILYQLKGVFCLYKYILQ